MNAFAHNAIHETTEHTTRFIDGFLAPWRAMNFLRWHVALLRYAVIPILINIVVFGLGLWLLIMKLQTWTNAIIPDTNRWWKVLLIILNILVIIIVIVAAFFLFTAVTRIIAAPFNEQLAKATETIVANNKEEEQEERLTIRLVTNDALRTIKEETVKIVFFVGVQAVILPINLIPGFGNIIYVGISTPLTWLFASYDFVDPPLARRKVPMKQRKAFMLRHKSLFFGFGFATTLLMAIPVINLIFMPIVIVAGTTLFLQHAEEIQIQKAQ